MHECQRVYSDKLIDDKDSDAFIKTQTDALKKFFDVSRYKIYYIIITKILYKLVFTLSNRTDYVIMSFKRVKLYIVCRGKAQLL